MHTFRAQPAAILREGALRGGGGGWRLRSALALESSFHCGEEYLGMFTDRALLFLLLMEK